MTSESEIIVAFIFKRSGKKTLKKSDFHLTLSMELNWFSPKQAKEFLDNAIVNGLLVEKNEEIKTSFNINNVVIPVGFYPSKKVFEETTTKKEITSEGIIDKIIEEIVKKSDLDKKNVIEEIAEIEKDKNITNEVAALLYAKDYDICLEGYLKSVEKKIFG